MKRAHTDAPASGLRPPQAGGNRLLACTVCFTMILAPAVALTAGCRRAPAGWSPVLERTSTEFLQRKVKEAAADVERARGSLPTNPRAASADLQRAAGTLGDLMSYYLPLLEAREGSYNAYRYLLLGETVHARQELDRVEKVLLEVARSDRPTVVGEMTLSLQELEQIRIAMDTGAGKTASDEPRARLERFAAHLDQLALKGGLVLDE